jgi:hypothetical protein
MMNRNYGREFVKCESKAQPGNVHIATFIVNFMFDLYSIRFILVV